MDAGGEIGAELFLSPQPPMSVEHTQALENRRLSGEVALRPRRAEAHRDPVFKAVPHAPVAHPVTHENSPIGVRRGRQRRFSAVPRSGDAALFGKAMILRPGAVGPPRFSGCLESVTGGHLACYFRSSTGIGVMRDWSTGVMEHGRLPQDPSLHHSNTPLLHSRNSRTWTFNCRMRPKRN